MKFITSKHESITNQVRHDRIKVDGQDSTPRIEGKYSAEKLIEDSSVGLVDDKKKK